MKISKGILIGTAISAGAIMLYAGTRKNGKKKMIKQGKKFMKSMGIA